MAKLKPSNNPRRVRTAAGTLPPPLDLSPLARLCARPIRHPNSERASSTTSRIGNTIQLENILKELSVPLNAAPELPRGDTVVILNSDGCTISLHRKVDGLWRFDQATIARIPDMYRAALAHHRDLQDKRKGLREGYTDPTTFIEARLAN